MMVPVRRELPDGTVTFLFTDVEGSTQLLHELGAEQYAQALAEHRHVLREVVARHGGVEVDTQGDAFFFAFPTATGAVEAAARAVGELSSGRISVRIGIHTGSPYVDEEGYVGADVHLAARIGAAGHGGQIVVSGATVALVGGDGVRELGEHRLKDFGEPVSLYQVGDDEFPPLKTISNTNLPNPASSFVGRKKELRQVVSLLQDGARLLTLTGPGGSGKTRLALEAATELVPAFRAGVFWVELAPLRDASLVTDTIARTLGAKDHLDEHIGERELLLLLDNLEQVVAAAPDLAALVETCPGLRLLVTSRELLRVRGEVEYRVSPLTDPEAAELFAARAQIEADPTVLGLCRALDNLPLAIELAAARTSVLSPRQIHDRLATRLDLLKGGRDADPRQQTLRATIEWSYELLSTDEKRVFARLAVFRGGCTLAAAEEVVEADLDTLQSLVDKSLVRHSDERFWMLETIREYAAEMLRTGDDEEATRARHFDHFLALCERAYEAQRLASEGVWFPVLEVEHDNIRGALDWARDRSAGGAAQLAGAVAPYWMMRGHTREALERLSHALSQYEARDAIHARALTHHGELEDAVPTLEEALLLWRELGDTRGEALVFEAIGWAHDAHGDYAAAQRAHEKSLELRRQTGAPELEGALARAGLCHVLVATGEIERAEETAKELLAIATQSEASLMQQLALHFLADCSLVAGDYEEAERRYLQALACARATGLRGRCTDEVLGIAMSLAGQGDAVSAVRLAAAAHAEQEVLGKSSDQWWTSMQERLIGGARARLAANEHEQAEHADGEARFDAILDELLDAETELRRTEAP